MRTILLIAVTVAMLVAVQSFRISRSVRLPHSLLVRNLFGFGNKNNEITQGGGSGKGGLGDMLGGMGNMMEALKKAQEAAAKGEALNKELEKTIVTGTDPTGQVVVTFNGLATPIGATVSDSILKQGSSAVSLAVTQAMLNAGDQSRSLMQSKMTDLYRSMGIPVPPKSMF